MTGPETVLQELDRAAIRSPNHLKQWLAASGRRYIIMKTDELVDSLPWPEGVEALIHLIECYRQLRCTRVVETTPCPRCKGKPAAVQDCSACGQLGIYNRLGSDVLEQSEVKEVIQFLLQHVQTTEPDWSP